MKKYSILIYMKRVLNSLTFFILLSLFILATTVFTAFTAITANAQHKVIITYLPENDWAAMNASDYYRSLLDEDFTFEPRENPKDRVFDPANFILDPADYKKKKRIPRYIRGTSLDEVFTTVNEEITEVPVPYKPTVSHKEIVSVVKKESGSIKNQLSILANVTDNSFEELKEFIEEKIKYLSNVQTIFFRIAGMIILVNILLTVTILIVVAQKNKRRYE